ncbi:uncharacterized protein LOC106636010 isoform X2 [Copidosoma floridanum]|uniref:uncharacterized protein LOC106636010 isoform X2 n=1 Tax=Copidosoma floridanum TaxID=29053 RepID=UPI0006C94AE4|nr:uncharacterized protein LOC106636010 isoform X2 [Copidosoma floridanum]
MGVKVRFSGGPTGLLLRSILAVLTLPLAVPGARAINITTVVIPSLIKAGSPEPVILDCKYELSSSLTKGLVIKWYVNQDLIYQWIFGSKPSGSDEFQKYIDDTFKASDEPHSMYRAVKLVRPSHELSGDVKCLVSTMYDEVQAVRKMLVYSPEKSFKFLDPVPNNATNELTFACLAEDLYPRPQIKIKLHRNRKPMDIAYKEYYESKLDGRYKAKAAAAIKADKIELPAIFQCEISIPEANYTSAQEYVYNGSHVPCLSLLLITLNLVTLKRY